MHSTVALEDRKRQDVVPHDGEVTKVRDAINRHQTELEDRVTELQKRREIEHRLGLIFKRSSVFTVTLGSASIAAAFIGNAVPWLVVLGATSMVLAIGLLAFCADHRAEERRICDELRRAEFECDLLKLRPSGEECSAEKMLGNNDSQLRSYYVLNLEQCSKIFWVGILCLCAGIGVIAATLYAVKTSTSDQNTQIVVGAVGAVGTILINYVAAIFLKMHSEILTILKDFQSKLVDTQELYLANVLTSRISDDKRSDALKDLSIAMVQCKEKRPG
jgi:hypothetical protein